MLVARDNETCDFEVILGSEISERQDGRETGSSYEGLYGCRDHSNAAAQTRLGRRSVPR